MPTTCNSTLTVDDLAMFQRLGISPGTLAAAGVRRVTHAEARDVCGIRYKSDHLEGIAFPYVSPLTDSADGYRVRRDHPEVESDGTPIAKYITSPDRRHLFFATDARPQLADVSTAVILVESEKAVLAIVDAARASARSVLPVAVGGCWGWRGRIGKRAAPDGTRVEEKGPLPDFDLIEWVDRRATIIFDSNAATNPKVMAARRALTVELEKRGARVHVVDLPVEPGINGPDDYIGRHGAGAFMALLDAARLVTRPADEDEDEKPARKSMATEIIELAVASGIELWHTPNGDPFATVSVGGHREHHPLRRVVRDVLSRGYYLTHGRAATSAALADAAATLAGMARFDGAEHPVAVRYAAHEGATYLDLGTADWQAVAITKDGWSIVPTCPVRHWRPGSLRPLPLPVAGGSLDALRELWPVDEDTWTLAMSWLVATLAPAGPYPILVETGEQGSGKSTFGRMLRGLVDPASPELRGVPRDERDVMIGALTSYVVALDNLSGLPAWLSDTLCRVATGGGLATRTLYSDLDETTIDVCRPILLTGIESPASRGDLLDRSLVVTLPAMSDEARGDERTLWARYHQMRPALLGALLDAAVCALRHQSTVVLERRPRMADACTWVTAAEPTLRWEAGRTATAWIGARQVASADLIASDPVAVAVMALSTPWEGTAGELLETLVTKVSEHTRKAKSWPVSPRGLSGALRRLAPDLRRAGIEVDFGARENTTGKRLLSIVTTVTTVTTPIKVAKDRDGRDGRPQPSRPTVTGKSNDLGPETASRDGRDGRDGSTHPLSSHEPEDADDFVV